MAGFRAAKGGVSGKFAPEEAAILRDLVGQVAGLIAGGGPERPAEPDELEAMVGLGPDVSPPDDPVLARLLPDGYTGDPEAAREFRRFTESGLRSAKIAAAREVLESLPPRGGKLELTGEQADAWLRALNDVRLALGVMLGVTDDFSYQAEADADEPRRFTIGVYDWLTFLQDSLITALPAAGGR